MSQEEEEDEGSVLYRTDGYWYLQTYKTLSKFVQKLKVDIFFSQSDLPLDIKTVMIQMAEKETQKYKPMEEIFRLLREYDTFINLELRAQLAKLGIQYDETDIYINVVNYAKAKGINLLDDTVLQNEVICWLGTKDWSSTTGGRRQQMRKIKSVIRKMSKGGKLSIKSRKIQNSHNLRRSHKKKIIISQ